jgi:hypothetical protein
MIIMNSNLVKCSRCGQIVSSEFFDKHECEIPIKGVKSIPVVYFYEDENKQNKSVTGRGLDGILYRFILNLKNQYHYPTKLYSPSHPTKT